MKRNDSETEKCSLPAASCGWDIPINYLQSCNFTQNLISINYHHVLTVVAVECVIICLIIL